MSRKLSYRFILALAVAILVSFLLFGASEDQRAAAEEMQPLEVDVFWSMRSPYCYIALDRILEMQKKYKQNFYKAI